MGLIDICFESNMMLLEFADVAILRINIDSEEIMEILKSLGFDLDELEDVEELLLSEGPLWILTNGAGARLYPLQERSDYINVLTRLERMSDRKIMKELDGDVTHYKIWKTCGCCDKNSDDDEFERSGYHIGRILNPKN